MNVFTFNFIHNQEIPFAGTQSSTLISFSGGSRVHSPTLTSKLAQGLEVSFCSWQMSKQLQSQELHPWDPRLNRLNPTQLTPCFCKQSFTGALLLSPTLYDNFHNTTAASNSYNGPETLQNGTYALSGTLGRPWRLRSDTETNPKVAVLSGSPPLTQSQAAVLWEHRARWRHNTDRNPTQPTSGPGTLEPRPSASNFRSLRLPIFQWKPFQGICGNLLAAYI